MLCIVYLIGIGGQTDMSIHKNRLCICLSASQYFMEGKLYLGFVAYFYSPNNCINIYIL